MRLFTVNLREVSKEDPTVVLFEGKIVTEIIPGRERLRVLKEINLVPNADGTISFTSNTIDAVIRGTAIVEKYIQEIDMVIDGEPVKTFEDLEFSSAFNQVIMKLILVIMNGPQRLGN